MEVVRINVSVVMVILNWRMEDVWRIVLLESIKIRQVTVIGVTHRACRVQGLHNSNASRATLATISTALNATKTHVQAQPIQ